MKNLPAYRLADNVSFTELDDEMVLLELTSGKYFGLNSTGCTMLQALLDGKSVEHSCELMAQNYQIDVEQVQKDMEDLMDQLIEQRLLVAETKI